MSRPACVEHAYAPRPTHFAGIRHLNGWRLRESHIALPGNPLRPEAFEDAMPLAAAALPQPPLAAGRFGAGFLILHQGRGVDYMVLSWWSRENELPMRVFVREPGRDWRAARGDESICVWDIEVIKRERDLFVRTILARPGEAEVEAYLEAV